MSLPTSDDLLIGGKFNRIKASDKSICISDGDAIFRFSRSGEFLGKITQKGQGPKQYLHINDFVLDKDENVWVASDHKKALLLYSWDNQVIKEIKIESAYVPRIHRIGDKLMITNAYPLPDNKHTLQIIDLNTGETTNKYRPIDEYKANYLRTSIHFTPGENDTVCYVNTNAKRIGHSIGTARTFPLNIIIKISVIWVNSTRVCHLEVSTVSTSSFIQKTTNG